MTDLEHRKHGNVFSQILQVLYHIVYFSLLSLVSPCVSMLSWLHCLAQHNLLPQGDPSLYHTVCGLFHRLVSHPPTVKTAGKRCSEPPVHQIYHCACLCLHLSVNAVSCRSASIQTPEWENGEPRHWQHLLKLDLPTNTILHWPKIR